MMMQQHILFSRLDTAKGIVVVLLPWCGNPLPAGRSSEGRLNTRTEARRGYFRMPFHPHAA
jgi:hypothetical protein